MRLDEIIGDDEDFIYNKLRMIYFIVNMYSDTPKRTDEFDKLYKDSITELYEDILNLDYWVLASERISKLYTEIKKII